MNKKMKVAILKAGGKKAWKAYAGMRRIPLSKLNTATKTMESRKRKPEKHRKVICAEM